MHPGSDAQALQADSQRVERLETLLATLQRAQKRQTGLLWILLGIMLLWSAVSVWQTVLANAYYRQAQAEGSAGASPPADIRDAYRYNGFDEWPTERKVAEASAIIVTQQQGEGKDARDVIAEVIKHAPGVEFHYQTGDVYDFGWRRSERAGALAEAVTPRHQIVFFVGSPARMNYAVSYDADSGRCSSLGGIQVEQLRELARQTPRVQRKG
ncbi:hypothetical protein [Ottowia oryzae]